MKLGFKKEELKDTLLLIATCVCVFFAFVGFCVNPFAASGQPSFGMDFGDLFKMGDGTMTAGFCFALFAFLALVTILVFMVFEIHGKFPKVTRVRMWLSLAVVVFFIISFGCIAGAAANYGMIPGEGAFFHFFFGMGAAVVSLWFNRGIKFWENK